MKGPLVGIILGSASDKKIAEKIIGTLEKLGVDYEITVASAHRTPVDAERYATNAGKRGLRIIIAVAGLSAALPGVVAAKTMLPVIGVPVESGALKGMDALLSIAQMPPGVPVATVGIDAGANAAILATRIISLTDDTIMKNLKMYVEKQTDAVKQSRHALSSFNQPPLSAFDR